jgi:hypothetical protein
MTDSPSGRTIASHVADEGAEQVALGGPWKAVCRSGPKVVICARKPRAPFNATLVKEFTHV